jgi:hypothetical protein
MVRAHRNMLSFVVLLAALGLVPLAQAQTDRYDALPNAPRQRPRRVSSALR